MTKPLKILFVNFPTIPLPQIELAIREENTIPHTMVIPLGILYLSSNIKARVDNVDIRILDCMRELKLHSGRHADARGMIQTMAEEMAEDFTPDLVCYSMLFSVIHPFFTLAATEHRKIWPESTFIVGGNHANSAIDIVLQHPAVDYVARGECDFAFPEFLKEFHNRENRQVQGIYSREHALAKKPMPLAEAPQDLDQLAFPDWDLLDIEMYTTTKIGRAYWRKEGEEYRREISFMTTRGCPYSCTFCAAHTTMGRKMRYRSVENVMAELKILNEKYGINLFVPEDDLFTANRKRVLKMLAAFKEFGKNIPHFEFQYPNALAVNTLFDDVLDALIDAGMRTTNVAIESGSDYVQRKIIKKNVKLPRAIEIIDYLRERGVHVRCYFLSGFPGETREMIEETIEFATNELKCDWAQFGVAVPLRGSEMYDQMIEAGFIEDDIELWAKAFFRERVFDTPEITAADLKELMYVANLERNFLKNPNYREQKWEKCIDMFTNMTIDYPFQIFSWYMLMKSYQAVGRQDDAAKSRAQISLQIKKDDRAADIYRKYGYMLKEISTNEIHGT